MKKRTGGGRHWTLGQYVLSSFVVSGILFLFLAGPNAPLKWSYEHRLSIRFLVLLPPVPAIHGHHIVPPPLHTNFFQTNNLLRAVDVFSISRRLTTTRARLRIAHLWLCVASIDAKKSNNFHLFCWAYRTQHVFLVWIFRFPPSRFYRHRLESDGASSHRNTFDTRDSRMFNAGADAQFNALCIDKNTWQMRRWPRNSVSHRCWLWLLKRCTSVLPQFIVHSRGRLLNDSLAGRLWQTHKRMAVAGAVRPPKLQKTTKRTWITDMNAAKFQTIACAMRFSFMSSGQIMIICLASASMSVPSEIRVQRYLLCIRSLNHREQWRTITACVRSREIDAKGIFKLLQFQSSSSSSLLPIGNSKARPTTAWERRQSPLLSFDFMA